MASTWYAAHIVMYVRFKDGQQDHFPIWENIVLIEATSTDIAFEKAEIRARRYAGDCDGSFTWNDRPAEWIFGGIRAMKTCVDPEDQPKDGTELTYIQFVLDSEAALKAFCRADEVALVISSEGVCDED